MIFKIHRKNYRECVLISALAGIILFTNAAWSQVLEEIVVTAQKREQSLQDVGVSITAYTGDQLSQLGYRNSVEIVQQTPGVTVAAYHANVTNMNIRGVSQTDFADQFEAPIANYVDNAYVTNMGMASTQLFDLERVEVLRGPQGTLFGRNATGGLMHYLSRKPTREFEAYAELTGGERELIIGEGAISGPLTDTIAARLSFTAHYDDGFMENRIGDDLRDNGVWAVRGQVLFDIRDKGEFLLKAYFSEDDTNGAAYTHTASVVNPGTWGPFGTAFPADGLSRFVPDDMNVYGTCPGCDLGGYKDTDGNPHKESLGSEGFVNPEGNDLFFFRSVGGVTGNLTYDLGGMTLNSVTDYLYMEKNYREDSDGAPHFGALYSTETDVWQFSQELKLSGETEQMTWMAGAYYLRFNTDQRVHAPATLTFGSPANGIPIIPYSVTTEAVIESETWALFGHLEYDIAPEWKIIAAIRYTEDDRMIRDHINYDAFGTLLPLYGVANAGVSINTLYPELTDQGWENVSAKIQLNWQPTDDLLLYGGFTRGHKAGNFAMPLGAYINAAFGSTEDIKAMPHDEEVLHSFEGGFKLTLADGRARLNASAFYYDYKDYQAFIFVGFTQEIGNVDAEVIGAEAELTFQPVDGLDLLFGVSVLDTEVEDFTRTALLPPSDQELPYTPDISFNGLARYEWPVWNGVMALQADFHYLDDFCFTLVCHPVEEEDGYVVGNVRVSYAAQDERWSITGFVNNVGDTEYRQYGLNLESVVTGVTNGFAPPRWFGATVRYNWH